MKPALSEDDRAASHEHDQGRFPRPRLGGRQIRTLVRLYLRSLAIAAAIAPPT